jgi:general L-amino acid transport system permease protein
VEVIPFYRNVRVLAMLAQVAFALGCLGLGWLLVSTMLGNLRQQGVPISFAFLRQPAGFGISEGLPFTPSQSYLTAFGVGVVNTLRVAVVGIVLATCLGIGVGMARLSRNWLLQRLATVYVETFRNVPLLLWLVFIYAAMRESLPRLREGPSLLWGMLLLSNRGLAMAWPRASATYMAFQPWLLVALLAGLGVWWWSRRVAQRRHDALPWQAVGRGLGVGGLVALAGFLLTWATARLPEGATVDREAGVAYVDRNGNGALDDDEPTLAGVGVTLRNAAGEVSVRTQADGSYTLVSKLGEVRQVTLTPSAPLMWSIPTIRGFNYSGGLVLSPEFTALLCGLVLYTASFIAEIVRAGVLAVPKGQREAAKALGLSDWHTFVLIIFPQALRVIIPPLINQYLNLTKNSSLAIAVGYPDLFSIGLTINNQTGQAMPFVLMIMATYLSMSLLTSLLLNLVNRRLALPSI